MEIERIRRWVWILVGAAVGFLGSEIYRLNPPEIGGRYGEPIGGRAEFEKAIVADKHGLQRFKDLEVYPEILEGDGGGSRRVHVVRGLYLDPRQGRNQNGQAAASRPRYFVADVPFMRSGDTARGDQKTGSSDTVMTYLDTLRSKGVSYRYSRWREPEWQAPIWVAGGVIAFGIIGASIVYFLAYGSIRQPPSQGWAWLSPSRRPKRVARPDSRTAAAAAAIGFSDKLTDEACPVMPAPVDAAPAVCVPAMLNEPVPQPHGGPDTRAATFGARQDDYYPTELKANHPPASE